jgi:hypothetical protein
MATDTWTAVYGGNWSDLTGWSGGTVPAAGDTVQLSQALNGPYTVHLDASEGAYAALTVSAANATLALYYGGLTLSVTGATTLSAGDIAIAGNATLDSATFAESGGFLGMSNGTLDVSGQATLSGGGFGVYGGAFEAGSLAFAGGSFGISGGDVAVTNQVTEWQLYTYARRREARMLPMTQPGRTPTNCVGGSARQRSRLRGAGVCLGAF